MGSGKPLPYMNGWVLITASFSLLYIFASYGGGPFGSPSGPTPTWLQMAAGAVYAAARTVASVFPAPFNGYLSTGVLFFAGLTTIGLKMLDAPLGSGKRFSSLERELAQRPGVKNPAALAATIGRNKLGKTRFQQLSARARRRK